MLNLITELLTYMFPGGRTVKLIKNRVTITNSSNPLVLTKNITLTVIDCCILPPLRLAAHCIAASVASPNPVTIGSAINLVTEIYEQC